MAKKIFVAATGQHKGKTTCTLGLVAALRDKGYDVGYCKPVGQQHLDIGGKMADKDAALFGNMLSVNVDPRKHSPVILASGVTTDYIDKPEEFHFEEDILEAARLLEEQHEVVVYEGTGHPGVGSIINFSNAQVAKLLDADVVLIAEGGIGKTFDRLNMSLALFREQGVNIRGVIINKVHADKLDRVAAYLQKILSRWNIPLLGVLPYDGTLLFPIISTIKYAVKGKVHFFKNKLDNQVEEILAGSLIEVDEFTYLHNMLLVVNHSRYKEAVEKIKNGAMERELDYAPLCGVIVTGDGRNGRWYKSEELENDYLMEHEIPVISTKLDTYDTVVKISRIEVKINTQTPWKIKRAIELIKEHVEIDQIIE